MGIVFDIQRYCVNDGPGIRTNVFLKGCPLKCLWCHNPESNSRKKQLYCDMKKCISCGRCVAVCPEKVHEITERPEKKHIIHFDRCRTCGKCLAACPTDALGIYGKEMNAGEILEIVLKDKDYYDTSGGGVTISGGEPMYQFAFALELARLFHENHLHVCMETSGFSTRENYLKIAPYIDTFLWDYKATGEELHRRLTGVPQKTILDNLDALLSGGSQVILRCPIIPGYNLSDDHFRAIAAYSRKGVLRAELIPYHDMGIGKAKAIGSDMYLTGVHVPDRSEVDIWIRKIKDFGGVNIEQA